MFQKKKLFFIKKMKKANGKYIDKTHDIGRIAIEVLQIDPSLESLLKRATRLSPFAVVFRYPTDDLHAPTQKEASEILGSETGIKAKANAPPEINATNRSGKLLATLNASSSDPRPNCLPIMTWRTRATTLLSPKKTAKSNDVLNSTDIR